VLPAFDEHLAIAELGIAGIVAVPALQIMGGFALSLEVADDLVEPRVSRILSLVHFHISG
jgi:hypothetical protein